MIASMYESFGDEFTKIAVFRAMVRGFGKALKAGWHGTPNDRVGKIGKGLTLLGAGASIPSAVMENDPTGQGRSRVERGLDTTGNIVGGLAGQGAGAIANESLTKRLKFKPGGLKSNATGAVLGLGTAIGGSIIGSRALTAPMRHSRKAYLDHVQRQALSQQEVPPEQGVA